MKKIFTLYYLTFPLCLYAFCFYIYKIELSIMENSAIYYEKYSQQLSPFLMSLCFVILIYILIRNYECMNKKIAITINVFWIVFLSTLIFPLVRFTPITPWFSAIIISSMLRVSPYFYTFYFILYGIYILLLMKTIGSMRKKPEEYKV